MLEKYLIAYCSPTLASLKPGSLFNFRCPEDTDLEGCISSWNELFRLRGISLHVLRRTESTALIYVCRDSAINDILSDPCVRSFLNEFGYDTCYGCDGCSASCCSFENCLRHLQTRITVTDQDGRPSFPHEIGIFLGYPLDDVSGFIKNKGRNCKLIGPWKVYGDAVSAQKAFAKFEKCSDVYKRLWKSGSRSIMELTVAC